MNDEPRRFFNQTQPQTLQIGVMLLYINAAFLFIGPAFRYPLLLLIMVGMAAGGYGIANEAKWGYQVGVGAALLNLVFPIMVAGPGALFGSLPLLLNFLFNFALVALLLHPQSREYQKIWFR